MSNFDIDFCRKHLVFGGKYAIFVVIYGCARVMSGVNCFESGAYSIDRGVSNVVSATRSSVVI